MVPGPVHGLRPSLHFCYVRAFELRAQRPSDDRYGTSIRVKTNIAEVMRREMKRRSWRGEPVAVGAATDPYQPAEGRYRLTRACIQVFYEARNPFSLITRSPLIIRDRDLIAEASLRADVSVTFSIPTLDQGIWRRTEPGTAPPLQRLRALRALAEAGVKAGVGVAPVLPGLSDDPELLGDVVRAARDAGAAFVWANVLYLRPGTREHFLDHLARDWPELLPHYEQLYAGRAYLDKSVTEAVGRTIADLRRRHGIGEKRWDDGLRRRPREQGPSPPGGTAGDRTPTPQQLSLEMVP